MKKFQWMTGLSIVALLLGSCTSNSNVSKAPTPKPSVGQVSVNPKPPVARSARTAAPVPGLIPSTNPVEIPLTRGRIDPFGSVAVPPLKQSVGSETTKQSQAKPTQTKQATTKPTQVKTQAQTKQTTTKPPQVKTQAQAKQTTTKPPQIKTQAQSTSKQKVSTSDKQSSPKRNVTPQAVEQPRPDSSKTTPVKPLPVPSPSAELASGVEVKGVMQVGGRVSAIVKEPGEKTSRYVSEGDYLAKGAVRVKRIQLEGNQEPIVILEENGVEVTKSVSSNDGPVASLP
jgi:hypothetical protein